MIRRIAVRAAVWPLVAATLVLINPGPSVASDPAATERTAQRGPVVGERCRRPGKIVFQVRDVRHDIRAAYARSFVLSPGEKWEIVRKVRRDQRVSSYTEATAGGEVAASKLGKLLAKVEITVDASLVDFNTTYTRKLTTVRKQAHNTTNQNRQFIAYKGTHNYRGRYKQFHCTKHPVMTRPEWTLRSKGIWRAHRPLEVGTIRCGAGYPSAVSKFVARRHCG